MGVKDVRAAAVARRAGKSKPAAKEGEGAEKKTPPQNPPAGAGDGGEKKE